MVSQGNPLTAQTVVTINGAVASNQLVTFTSGSPLVTLNPPSGTALTDAQGIASVQLVSTGSSSGAGQVTATVTAPANNAGSSVLTATANFSVGAGSVQAGTVLSLDPVVISPTSISSYGTAAISTKVVARSNGTIVALGTPVDVSFTLSCGHASVTTATVRSLNDGTVTNTFNDNGCAIAGASVPVTVSASIPSSSQHADVTVLPPTSGSIQFVSAVPSDKSITLQGQGGNGRVEVASLTFKLVDTAGNGVPNQAVCFDATTYVGGLTVDGFQVDLTKFNASTNPTSTTVPATSRSTDHACHFTAVINQSQLLYSKLTDSNGQVVVQINSGTTPTPVRLIARAFYANAEIQTTSDTVSISTGLPLQRSMDLSVDKANIDGRDWSGEVANFTVRLADQFGNPVPDGTIVNFIGSGASVCTSQRGACSTVNGACSCAVTGQERRPADGRVVILSYADGLEDYTDVNSDNIYEPGEPFVKLGDAYVDADKNGSYSPPPGANGNGDDDVLVSYDHSNIYNDGTAQTTRVPVHIRRSAIIYLSATSSLNPTVIITAAGGQISNTSSILTDKFVRLPANCPVDAPQGGVAFQLEDGFGNPMAAGTTLGVTGATPNVAGSNMLPSEVLAFGARAPSSAIDFQNIAPTATFKTTETNNANRVYSSHSVTVAGVAQKCAGSGSLQILVKSPKGASVPARILFAGEPRTTARFQLDVQYQ
jgi:hypothetical protein